MNPTMHTPQGTVQWELMMKAEYDFRDDPNAVMPARPYHREVRGFALEGTVYECDSS